MIMIRQHFKLMIIFYLKKVIKSNDLLLDSGSHFLLLTLLNVINSLINCCPVIIYFIIRINSKMLPYMPLTNQIHIYFEKKVQLLVFLLVNNKEHKIDQFIGQIAAYLYGYVHILPHNCPYFV